MISLLFEVFNPQFLQLNTLQKEEDTGGAHTYEVAEDDLVLVVSVKVVIASIRNVVVP